MKSRRAWRTARSAGVWVAAALLGGVVAAGCGHTAPSAPTSLAASPAPAYLAPAAPAVVPSNAPVAAKSPARARVALGIDVLAARHFDILQGKRVGLLTHAAGVNRDGVSTVEVLRRAPGVNLVALYELEHGLYGDISGTVALTNSVDSRTGLPVISLYNGTGVEPTAAMLKNIDVLVVDLQDIGVRSYTYISGLRKAMEGCFKQNKTVVVLDRPNPLGGLKVGGPMLDRAFMSYVGEYIVPYVHGLTIGEIARIAKDNPGWLSLTDEVRQRGQLIVVPMSGWRRSMLWPDTGLKWVSTSPNVTSASAAFGYGEVGLAGIISDGLGHGIHTPHPFRLLNYPGKTPAEFAAALRSLRMPGLDFTPITYVEPNDPKHIQHSGVYVVITDWNAVVPTQLSFELMRLVAAWSTDGNPFANASTQKIHEFDIHVGAPDWLRELQTKGGRADVAGFFRKWDAQDAAFQQWSKRWWLYPQ